MNSEDIVIDEEILVPNFCADNGRELTPEEAEARHQARARLAELCLRDMRIEIES